MSESNQLNLLEDALEEYIAKWQQDKEDTGSRDIKIQRSGQIHLARWIINSIHGGLDKIHATNICNIILRSND